MLCRAKTAGPLTAQPPYENSLTIFLRGGWHSMGPEKAISPPRPCSLARRYPDDVSTAGSGKTDSKPILTLPVGATRAKPGEQAGFRESGFSLLKSRKSGAWQKPSAAWYFAPTAIGKFMQDSTQSISIKRCPLPNHHLLSSPQ